MAVTRSPAPGSTTRRRWPRAGRGQRSLLGASFMVIVGSFLPWVDTAFGTFIGSTGAGLWTFYAAMLGLAGALVSHRTLAGVQAAILGMAAVVLPAWQAVHLLRLVGFEGWAPGPGLVLTFGGGVLALTAARSLFRSPDEPQA